MVHQKTMTCRCGKKHELPYRGQGEKTCGCGRKLQYVDGRCTAIIDKRKGK